MRIVDELRREHLLIDRLAGSLRRWAERGAEHPEAAADRVDLVHVLEVFVLGHHHGTEELLFGALVEHAEVPGHQGPIALLRREHEAAADAIRRFATADLGPPSAELAAAIAADLWQHLDKEESVLLHEVERRLIDGGIRDLDPPKPSTDVAVVRELGLELLLRLPPVDDPELVRGDGCIACHAFGRECHGIEAEWWSDWERMHHASLDEG